MKCLIEEKRLKGCFGLFAKDHDSNLHHVAPRHLLVTWGNMMKCLIEENPQAEALKLKRNLRTKASISLDLDLGASRMPTADMGQKKPYRNIDRTIFHFK